MNKDPNSSLVGSLKDLGLSPEDIGLSKLLTHPNKDTKMAPPRHVAGRPKEASRPTPGPKAEPRVERTLVSKKVPDGLPPNYYDEDDAAETETDEDDGFDEFVAENIEPSAPSKNERRSPKRVVGPKAEGPIQSIQHMKLMCIYVHVLGEDPHVQIWTQDGKHLVDIHDPEVISSIYDD